eukprot:1219614-Prymnesium_polylepis.1
MGTRAGPCPTVRTTHMLACGTEQRGPDQVPSRPREFGFAHFVCVYMLCDDCAVTMCVMSATIGLRATSRIVYYC